MRCSREKKIDFCRPILTSMGLAILATSPTEIVQCDHAGVPAFLTLSFTGTFEVSKGENVMFAHVRAKSRSKT